MTKGCQFTDCLLRRKKKKGKGGREEKKGKGKESDRTI